jgi:hypothetical protein
MTGEAGIGDGYGWWESIVRDWVQRSRGARQRRGRNRCLVGIRRIQERRKSRICRHAAFILKIADSYI